MRDAEARALAESGLGSGLLARQRVATEAESVAVLKFGPAGGVKTETHPCFCPIFVPALRHPALRPPPPRSGLVAAPPRPSHERRRVAVERMPAQPPARL